MNDLRSFTTLLYDRDASTKGKIFSDGAFAASNLLPFLHRLLTLSAKGPTTSQNHHEILRLGCILFLAEIRRMFGIVGIISSTHTRKLRVLLESQTKSWEELGVLRAWVLAIGAMESTRQNRAWFFGELQTEQTVLGFNTLEELEARFREVLWFDKVHCPMYRELCSGHEYDSSQHVLGGSRFGGYRSLR
jgi:hypothetical protein